MQAQDGDFRENSQAVQAHLNFTQNVIQRMASNSASCKAYCITLVSAILVLVLDKGRPEYSLLALMPTGLFLALDTYYLALERIFRASYNDFVSKLHAGHIVASDLFAVEPAGRLLTAFPKAAISFSIWPFYATLVVIEFLAQKLLC